MNTLTQIRPNRANELKDMIQHANPRQAKQFKYLPDSQLEQHMAKIHDYIFATTVDAHGRNACKLAAKGFAFTIPHIDRYAMDMKRCDIQEKDLQRHYRDVWHQLPEPYRNKIRKAAQKYNKQVAATIHQLQEFVDHHSKHLNTLDDEQMEQVMDLEPNEVEATLSTDIRSYFKPAQKQTTDYLLTCKTIAVNLALASKGVLYLEPREVAKELGSRGFKAEKMLIDGKQYKGYYVELVK